MCCVSHTAPCVSIDMLVHTFLCSPGIFFGFVALAAACVRARLSTITATNKLTFKMSDKMSDIYT